MAVYLAEAGGGRLKIGFTARDPRDRAKAQGCKLLAYAPGDRATESDLIRRFAKLRVNGREWFKDHPRIRAHFHGLPGVTVMPQGTALQQTVAYFNEAVREEAVRLLNEVACSDCQRRLSLHDFHQFQMFEQARRFADERDQVLDGKGAVP